jgi:ASC-1-like (ASCH) protein
MFVFVLKAYFPICTRRICESNLPMFLAKKEVFKWLMQGQKTIDVRKGNPRPGEIAVFQSGPNALKLKIVKTESGPLSEILRLDNFKAVIPSAVQLDDAFDYLRAIYGVCNGVFTAYYVEPLS